MGSLSFESILVGQHEQGHHQVDNNAVSQNLGGEERDASRERP